MRVLQIALAVALMCALGAHAVWWGLGPQRRATAINAMWRRLESRDEARAAALTERHRARQSDAHNKRHRFTATWDGKILYALARIRLFLIVLIIFYIAKTVAIHIALPQPYADLYTSLVVFLSVIALLVLFPYVFAATRTHATRIRQLKRRAAAGLDPFWPRSWRVETVERWNAGGQVSAGRLGLVALIAQFIFVTFPGSQEAVTPLLEAPLTLLPPWVSALIHGALRSTFQRLIALSDLVTAFLISLTFTMSALGFRAWAQEDSIAGSVTLPPQR
jgi:hypothetical protein